MALCVGITKQAAAGYEPHEYTEPGTGLVLEYNLYVPNNYDAAKKYPLLVFLHAAGQADVSLIAALRRKAR
jgi:predicted peptidase